MSNWLKALDFFDEADDIRVGHYNIATHTIENVPENCLIRFEFSDTVTSGRTSIYIEYENDSTSELEVTISNSNMNPNFKFNSSNAMLPVVGYTRISDTVLALYLDFTESTVKNVSIVGIFNKPVDIDHTNQVVTSPVTMQALNTNLLQEGTDYGTQLPASGVKGRIFYVELQD